MIRTLVCAQLVVVPLTQSFTLALFSVAPAAAESLEVTSTVIGARVLPLRVSGAGVGAGTTVAVSFAVIVGVPV